MAEVSVNPRVRLRSVPVVRTLTASDAGALLQHPLTQAALHLLRELIVGNGLRLVPTQPDTPIPDEEQALFAQVLMTDGLDTALRHLVQAYLIGVAAAEIVWGEDYMPETIRAIPVSALQVGFDEGGQMQALRVATLAGVQELPLEHAILYVHNPSAVYPLGEPLIVRYKRYLDAYDATLRALHLYVQRHGSPTTLAQLPPTYTEQEVQAVYEALAKLHDALVAVVPAAPDTKIEYIEPRGTGMDLALQMLSLLERIFVRSLLGSILAVYEAQYGTRAQAQVHWEVMQRIIAGMQRPLERALDAQLWRRVASLHLPRGATTQLELNEPTSVNREHALRSLADLVALGIINPATDRDWLRKIIGLD